MNGQVMNCNTYENRKIVENYVNEFNPYENHPSIDIDLVALTRYAKNLGKKTSDLTSAEIASFHTHK